jgi:KDO2-lipid IV(A) lauroyltransferase
MNNNNKRDTVGNWIAYSFLKVFIKFSAISPKSFIYSVMKMLTLTFYYLSSRRKKITIDNLTHAFPSKSKEEIEKLSKEVFIELSKTISEILFMVSKKFDIDEVIVNKDEALEKLKMLKDKHKNGWIVITAHFSNWEIAAQFLAKHGYSMLAIGREGDNRLIDKNITLPLRQKYGNRTAYKKNAAISIFKNLKKGNNVGVLIDQKTNKSEGVQTKFFGRDVYTTAVVASMKNKLDVTVVPIFLVRIKDGKYKLIVQDPIMELGDVNKMTQSYSDAMEDIIRKYPSQWFWMHNRWKI